MTSSKAHSLQVVEMEVLFVGALEYCTVLSQQCDAPFELSNKILES